MGGVTGEADQAAAQPKITKIISFCLKIVTCEYT